MTATATATAAATRAATDKTAAPAPAPKAAPVAEPKLRALAEPTRAPRRGAAALHRLLPSRRLLAAIGAAAILVLVLVANLLVHVAATQGQFELDRLEHQAADRQDRYAQLRLQVAQLEAPQRIVEQAHRLGMVEPPKVTYLTPTEATTSGAAPTGPAAAKGGSDPSPGPEQAAGDWQQVKARLAGGRP